MGGRYAVNMFNLMYIFSSVAFGLGVFSTWKAAHRGGMTFWRRTLRPALLCAMVVLMGAALTLELCFLKGNAQMIGVALVGMAALAFTVVWFLRGPDYPIRPSDGYWNRALAVSFLVLAIGAATFLLVGVRSMRRLGNPLARPQDAPLRVSVLRSYRYDKDGNYVPQFDQLFVPTRQYDHLPLAAGLVGLLALGSFGESRYRWRQVGRLESHSPNEVCVR